MNKYQKQKLVQSKIAEQMLLNIKENLEEIKILPKKPPDDIALMILLEIKNINVHLDELKLYFKNCHM